jgi:cytochrome c1
MLMKRLAALTLVLAVLGCHQEDKAAGAKKTTSGNADAGRAAIDKYGCSACHIIPGVDAPRGTAGPSLEHLKSRPLLAGKLPNTPENAATWMQNPQAVNPLNAMPNLGVTPDDARNIAAYLYAQQ